MTFAAIQAGLSFFMDANPLLYYFTAHPRFGTASQSLLDRIERQDVTGFTSAHILNEVVHRLMTIEACQRFGWPIRGIARRLRHHPAEVKQLDQARQAMDEITLIGLQVLAVEKSHVSRACDISRQTGLLSSDAVLVAVMQANGLTHLASADPDFDRVPGITRYSPV